MSLSYRTLLCTALIILLAITGIWSGQPLAGIWRWPAVLLLVLIAWEHLQINNNFAIIREIPASIILGQETRYQQTLKNYAKEKLLLESQPDYPDAVTGKRPIKRWIVDAKKTRTEQFTIIPTELGTNSLGTLHIRILGLFGLVWWSRRINDEVNFKVEPEQLKHTLALPGQAQSGTQRSRFKPGSGFELLDLREYQHGDSLRSIDWKATARRRRPIVRLFNQEQRLEIAILIDCGRASRIRCGLLDRLHHYVNIAARLTDFAIRNGDRVACIAYANQILNLAPVDGGLKALKCTRTLLGKLSSTAEESNPLNVALQMRHFLKRRGLIIFLSEIEQAEAASQLVQAVHLLAAKHHVLVASLEDESITKIQNQPAQLWLDPYLNFAAFEYRRGRELTISKLRRSGVSVVTAAAGQIDREVLSCYQKLRDRAKV